MTVARFSWVFVTMISVAATGTPTAQTPPLTPDVPAKFEAPSATNDYVERDVMIPMDKTAFATLRELTLLGYFTSEIGCTQALAYEAVPGGYRGCIDLKPGQKAWATR